MNASFPSAKVKCSRDSPSPGFNTQPSCSYPLSFTEPMNLSFTNFLEAVGLGEVRRTQCTSSPPFQTTIAQGGPCSPYPTPQGEPSIKTNTYFKWFLLILRSSRTPWAFKSAAAPIAIDNPVRDNRMLRNAQRRSSLRCVTNNSTLILG